MSNSDKIEILKRSRICFSCIKGNHMSKKCWSKRVCNIKSDGQKWGKDHHPLLHKTYIKGVMFHMTLTWKLESRVRDKTLLMMNKLYSTSCSTPLNTLWDPGSDSTLVRFDAACRLGLTGKEVTRSQRLVGEPNGYIGKNILSLWRTWMGKFGVYMGSRTLHRSFVR